MIAHFGLLILTTITLATNSSFGKPAEQDVVHTRALLTGFMRQLHEQGRLHEIDLDNGSIELSSENATDAYTVSLGVNGHYHISYDQKPKFSRNVLLGGKDIVLPNARNYTYSKPFEDRYTKGKLITTYKETRFTRFVFRNKHTTQIATTIVNFLDPKERELLKGIYNQIVHESVNR